MLLPQNLILSRNMTILVLSAKRCWISASSFCCSQSLGTTSPDYRPHQTRIPETTIIEHVTRQRRQWQWQRLCNPKTSTKQNVTFPVLCFVLQSIPLNLLITISKTIILLRHAHNNIIAPAILNTGDIMVIS